MGLGDLNEAVIPYAYDPVQLAAGAQLERDANDAKEGGLAPFVETKGRLAGC